MNTKPADTSNADNEPGASLPVLVTIVSLVQSGALLLFAAAGTLPVWTAISFLALSGGSALAFLVYCTSGSNRHSREARTTIPLLVVSGVLQLVFLALAPRLTIVFLLAIQVLFGFSLLKLRPEHAQKSWAAYGFATGVIMLFLKDQLGYPSASTLEFALLWAIFFLAMRALAMLAGEFQRLRNALADARRQLRTAEHRAEQLVRHDPLTGALNRRALMETLDGELQRARRTGHPFCFATLDLDHFKAINDRYGHASGDLVLKTMSDTSIRLLRALDRFGRLDGEQFGIVLPATWLDQGTIAMSRLTKAVNGQNWDGIAPGLTLTFSAGLTTNAPNDTAESIILRAEKAMRQAKNEGRNRVVQMEEPLPVAADIDL